MGMSTSPIDTAIAESVIVLIGFVIDLICFQ